MRWLTCLAVLAACEHGSDPKPKPQPVPPPAVAPIPKTAKTTTGDFFANWHRITLTEERMRCANYSDAEWRVAVDGNTVRATPSTEHEPDTGPALPFALPKGEPFRGRRHTLAVSDGFLVGLDAGEWGGALYWFSADGKQKKELARENVRGFVALSPDAVVALEGLAHLSLSEGRARWLGRDAQGWHETHVDALDGSVQTFTQSGKSIYVATTVSLTRVDGPKQVRVMKSLNDAILYPDTMAVDPQGRIFLGMRQLVLRLVPNGTGFDEEWLAPPNCREATRVDLECVCKP